MQYVLDAISSHALDVHLINDVGIASAVLMENAAQAVVSCAMSHHGKILILCGCGNNGGDGFAILRKLHVLKRNAEAVVIGDTSCLNGGAKTNYEIACRLNLPIIEIAQSSDVDKLEMQFSDTPEIIIDALFGTGLVRDVLGLYAKVISLANECDAYRIAVDIPSGINSDTGKIMGTCFEAHETVTFQTAKRGQLLYPGREHCGKLIVKKIAMTLNEHPRPKEFYLECSDVSRMLPKRCMNSFKGDYGNALLIAGSSQFTGACVLSATAALRMGVGLLKVFCPNSVAQVVRNTLPEAIVYSFDGDWDTCNISKMNDAVAWADSIGIGPGLGASKKIATILQSVLESNKPTVVDADAINVLALNKNLFQYTHENVVFTPHVGEMSRLCGTSTQDILSDLPNIARKFSIDTHSCIILKSATSVVCNSIGNICYNITGNAGLAKGGSGDVLCGLVLGLLAQRKNSFDAACLGSYLMGACADLAVEHMDMHSLFPSDVINALPCLLLHIINDFKRNMNETLN